MKRSGQHGLRPFLWPLVGIGVWSVAFYILQVVGREGSGYWFLNWNLFLAALPVVFALLLRRLLRRVAWSDWRVIACVILWLGFLPNSFYLTTDYIHLPDALPGQLLFNVLLFGSYMIAGLVYGFFSMGVVYGEIRRRLEPRECAGLVQLVLLLSSFAIYLGRDLRWNTWDLLVNPAGILFDVSDRLIQPQAHPEVFITTITFWLFLSGLYWVGYGFVRALRRAPDGRL